MTVDDVYLLAAHEPYVEARHPVPINFTIVAAASLRHPHVLQPDGGMIYRCLTEFPNRHVGEIVPLSTITFELAGGDLWPQVADFEAGIEDVVALARAGGCDAVPLGLPQVAAVLLNNGPQTVITLHRPDGGTEQVGPAHRQAELDKLTAQVRAYAEQAPFWPGDHLVPAPRHVPLPYRPYRPVAG